MTKTRTLLTAAATLALGACAHAQISAPPDAAQSAPTHAQVRANFDLWKAALATKDPKVVAALFAPDAILEPTVSNQIRDTPSEVEDYFVDFLKLSPTPTINERYIRVLDENTAIDAGIWTFDLVRDGKTSWVTARYSFVWEKINGVWKIQLLHSSAAPEPLTSKPLPLAQ